MQINGTEIDFSKQRGYFFQMDCMKALKQMPDKCIDLCICDPPYGDGIAESSQICQVERERERETAKPWNRFGGRFDRYKNLENLGQDKVGGNFDRYKEQAEHGLKNMPKKS